ncbi:3-oxo-tetronate kinase [Bartonella tamiae]|uniref:3-oxo-tetronate kinase n=1 Tax=Bartonella tamiae Th239 TaxID=1094558 RepID=J1JWB7_9HYPH|nr:3-oxo-tetronate kinase [Bartonella tamiae]EJF89302.1 hypothetical protein ME5_01853 [Bartonella tamiae Th239]EJF95536.1 hypothetical protein MEG_00026 [Bartonella tamiae Th307]
MRFGVIADDFTGATDIAGFLVSHGLRTIQLNGVPTSDKDIKADAVVISLKSRSCASEKAVADSLSALKWLQVKKCQQFFFKYCSTFDSTLKGNIGPVTDALLEALGEKFTVVCPALPVNGRTLYNGYLFVNGVPLNESGMRDHPVNPMTDSNIMRIMESQSVGKAGNIDTTIIDQGVSAVTDALNSLKNQNIRYAVLDALNMDHIDTLGQAVSSMKLVTGGSGLAAGMAKTWIVSSNDTQANPAELLGAPLDGATVIISGSCSQMTNAQVDYYKQKAPSLAVDIAHTLHDENYAHSVLEWVLENKSGDYAPLVYATMKSDDLKTIQQRYGAKEASLAIEAFFAKLAQLLEAKGFTRFIVAGGETSGSVTQALHVDGFAIGPQIAPGVPWVRGLSKPLSLALKSGNFGQEDFFFAAQNTVTVAQD